MTLVGLVSLADWYPLDDDSHECSCEQVFVCGYRRTAERRNQPIHRPSTARHRRPEGGALPGPGTVTPGDSLRWSPQESGTASSTS